MRLFNLIAACVQVVLVARPMLICLGTRYMSFVLRDSTLVLSRVRVVLLVGSLLVSRVGLLTSS
jgi:predicted transporter